MKILHDPALLQSLLSRPACTDYFEPQFRPYFQLVEFSAGDRIVHQDAPADRLYLMLDGRCHVRVGLANGKSVILHMMRPPCLIGEMELLRQVSPFTVLALETCHMLALPMEPCGPMLLENVYFLRRVASDLVWKERGMTLTLLHTFGYPLENRLAKFLLDNRQGDCCDIRKVVMAESLGVSYRHMESVMSRFVRAGYLSKEKLTYRITDQGALAALARDLDSEI